MVSQYASPFPLSMQAGDPVLSTQSSFNMDEFFKDLQHDKPQFCAPNVSMLPTDIGSSMTKLPSCRRWVKLSALVKWKAILRASKRARLMFDPVLLVSRSTRMSMWKNIEQLASTDIHPTTGSNETSKLSYSQWR